MTVNTGGCLDPACGDLGKIGRCIGGKNIFNEIRFLSRNAAFFQLFSVEGILCTAQGTDSSAKGSIDCKERNGKLGSRSFCSMA